MIPAEDLAVLRAINALPFAHPIEQVSAETSPFTIVALPKRDWVRVYFDWEPLP